MEFTCFPLFIHCTIFFGLQFFLNAQLLKSSCLPSLNTIAGYLKSALRRACTALQHATSWWVCLDTWSLQVEGSKFGFAEGFGWNMSSGTFRSRFYHVQNSLQTLAWRSYDQVIEKLEGSSISQHSALRLLKVCWSLALCSHEASLILPCFTFFCLVFMRSSCNNSIYQ